MKKAFVEKKYCVACGCCLTACRFGAITIPRGVFAIVDEAKCVGCGICSKKCPACAIQTREVERNEEK